MHRLVLIQMRQDDAVEAPVGAKVEQHELAVGLSLGQCRLNVLWASARLSYGPCERAGVYAPMASVRRVASASLFIRASMVRQGYGKSTLRARQGFSIYPRIRVLLSRARGPSGSRSGRPSRARASCPGILPQKEQEKPHRVHRAMSDHGHPEIAAGGQVQEPEHETTEPRGDHARQPLVCVTDAKENAGNRQRAEPRPGRATQRTRDPRQQVAAIHEFLAEGGERPRDSERDEQKVDVARQRSKQADVRELAREPGDSGLGDVEAEALIDDAGPDTH